MTSGLTLQNADWIWDFTTAENGLQVSIHSTRLALPLPANGVRLCVVAGQIITQIAAPSANMLRVEWSGGVRLDLTLTDNRLLWKLEASQPSRVEFPYWASFYTSEAQGVLIRNERSFQDAGDLPIIRHIEYTLPATCIGADGTALTLLFEQGLSFADLSGKPLDAGCVLQGSFVLHGDGWRGAFAQFRQQVRSQTDLSEYQRDDLAWYQSQWVQHFTFLYGREILNLKTHRFELERFLDESERDFGGYDGILLWGGYPRLGVDERTQWDFFDDLPGGRPALRARVELAHAHGVRVFVPYKPWDQSLALHGQPAPSAPDELARLLSEINADGVFLDTMSSLDRTFRTAIDGQRPGVVLCSELRVTKDSFEMITGSWDQSYTRSYQQGNWSAVPERMPGLDLGRFIFPEHRLFVINRHAVGDDRLTIIKRGFFGGTGWVVWQDIFGLVLTYAPDEAALLRKCRTIFRAHEDVLNSGSPTPLLPTLIPGVYCNEFVSEHKRFWTFYNETDEIIDAAVLAVEARPDVHWIDVWNDCELSSAEGQLHLRLKPHDVGAVVELPRSLDKE
ncbi:MAG TPA: hypothetical protein VHD90_13070 [Phototrophicaceae bacterium]|nr:hypothetical protein [Phototrophicaceae bacterium]